ncbi:Cyclin-dependent kinase [Bertholletia excelsa]
MGCINSKEARSPRSAFDSTTTSTFTVTQNSHFDSSLHKRGGFKDLEKIKEEPQRENEEEPVHSQTCELKKSKSIKKANSNSKAVFSLRIGRYKEAEQIAAGWPSWLSAVAGEAVEGWLPLRVDLFEKLNKIGQGTYSNVYRARDVETGRIVALKKVKFDTFQEESIKFMAREIKILRRLDHPNVMKLEGIITNKLSCSIYLVFEYMEHDISRLLSCPDVAFSDAQIKCYMKQLLAGLEHCHLKGVMHRDIKASNILLNNEGILKIGDFGLANYISSRHRQALTSRVVTLWYRPPELLLGSRNYGAYVDLWSVGCVFAELFIGKPILKGRTEVEQLHKIFELCGSPPDEYWKKSKLPLAAMFKPQHAYVSSLREMFKEFPESAVNLLETLLSIEPRKRGTSSSALNSEYFTTKPCACDPSSLPKYPPNKEIAAKMHEEGQRRKTGAKSEASGTLRNPRRGGKAFQEPNSISKAVLMEEAKCISHVLKAKGAVESWDLMISSSYDTVCEASQATEASHADSINSLPVVTPSTNFAWAENLKRNFVSRKLHNPASSKGQNMSALDPSSVPVMKNSLDSKQQQNQEFPSKVNISLDGSESYEVAMHVMWKQQGPPYTPDSLGASNLHHPLESSMGYNDKERRFQSSRPLLCQPHRLLEESQENHIRQAIHGSRIYRG